MHSVYYIISNMVFPSAIMGRMFIEYVHVLSNKRVLLHCDNESVTYIVNLEHPEIMISWNLYAYCFYICVLLIILNVNVNIF